MNWAQLNKCSVSWRTSSNPSNSNSTRFKPRRTLKQSSTILTWKKVSLCRTSTSNQQLKIRHTNKRLASWTRNWRVSIKSGLQAKTTFLSCNYILPSSTQNRTRKMTKWTDMTKSSWVLMSTVTCCSLKNKSRKKSRPKLPLSIPATRCR